MIVFYDPNNDNQVMAVYSHDTDSPVWESQGFLRAEVKTPEMKTAVSRNSTVVIERSEVVSATGRVNLVQPAPDPVAVRVGELEAKWATTDLTLKELNEHARLLRGL